MSSATLQKQTDGEVRSVSPLVNVRETGNEIILEVEMPGLTKDDISVEINQDELTIRGKRGENVPETYEIVYRERPPYQYQRTFSLGSQIDRSGVRAVYENGILILTLPKTEEVKPKQIKVE